MSNKNSLHSAFCQQLVCSTMSISAGIPSCSEVEVGSVAYVAVLLQGSTAPVQSAGTPALSGKLLRCRLGPRPAAGPLHRFCTDEPAEPEEEESSGKAAAGQEPSYAPSAHTCWTPRCNHPMLSGPMHILISLSYSYHLITNRPLSLTDN